MSLSYTNTTHTYALLYNSNTYVESILELAGYDTTALSSSVNSGTNLGWANPQTPPLIPSGDFGIYVYDSATAQVTMTDEDGDTVQAGSVTATVVADRGGSGNLNGGQGAGLLRVDVSGAQLSFADDEQVVMDFYDGDDIGNPFEYKYQFYNANGQYQGDLNIGESTFQTFGWA
jgi:hypothetical protein